MPNPEKQLEIVWCLQPKLTNRFAIIKIMSLVNKIFVKNVFGLTYSMCCGAMLCIRLRIFLESTSRTRILSITFNNISVKIFLAKQILLYILSIKYINCSLLKHKVYYKEILWKSFRTLLIRTMTALAP